MRTILAALRKIIATLIWRLMTWRPRFRDTTIPPDYGASLWHPGSTAFWLDPHLFWPVEDTHRDMCWMLLNQRPTPPKVDPLWMVRSENGPGARGNRDEALAVLASANVAEDFGAVNEARRLRKEAVAMLRNGSAPPSARGRGVHYRAGYFS